jgi:hypothetical protein
MPRLYFDSGRIESLMKKLLSGWLFAVILVVVLCIAPAHAHKPKPKVQLYGERFDAVGQNVYDENHKIVDAKAPFTFTYTAFLILPDGSHASAQCTTYVGEITLSAPCAIEPFAAGQTD